MKVLVLATDYPRPDGWVKLMYIHMRNIFYAKNGIDVCVLNFSARKGYKMDGISVVTLEEYKASGQEYEILVSHAPNIRNHYRFLKKYQHRFGKIIFVFHGHEVLRIGKVYPKPFAFAARSSFFARIARDAYDVSKLFMWKRYFPKLAEKSHFVFVSQWMQEHFFTYTGIQPEKLLGNTSVINNSVGAFWETAVYNPDEAKEYDFITIRSSLDDAKYCVDLVNMWAKCNPQYRFLLIGRGSFFSHVEKAENLVWENTTLYHAQMMDYLNSARCALMPTRQDTQGLMSCEMASIGMPLITSDITVCREILDVFPNVSLIQNAEEVDLQSVLKDLAAGLPYDINERYHVKNTVAQEIALFKDAE